MGKKILVADDSLTIQKVIKLALASEGYDILAVSDGNEAIKAIKQERPDVVLVDMKLPGLDAFNLKELSNSEPTTANISFVLMVSAFEKVDEHKISALNFQGRLVKPFDPSHLRKVVAQAVQKSTPHEPAVNLETIAKTVEKTVEKTTASDDFELPAPPDIHGIKRPVENVPVDESPADELPADLPKISFDLNTEPLEQENLPESTKQIIRDLPPLKDLPPIEDNQPIIMDFTGEEEQESSPKIELKIEQKIEEMDPESDIRGLTQTTIEMSKLDEFDWNLEDKSKMKQPPPPPPAAKEQIPPAFASDTKVTELFPGKIAKVGLPQKPFDHGNSSFLKAGHVDIFSEPPKGKEEEESKIELEPIIEVPDVTAEIIKPKIEERFSGGSAQGMSHNDLEAIIRSEISKTLEKIAREEVPRIAETVIRKEIERILSEP